MSIQASDGDAVACEHGELWLARDGVWRCELCQPPAFVGEVVDRKQVVEMMRLFDVEERDRARAA